MHDVTATRQVNRGYGDGLSRALEIVLTPLFFGGGGYLLDSWLGTAPGLMLGLGVFAMIGVFVKLWYEYDQEMRLQESKVRHHGRSAPPMPSPDRPAGGPATPPRPTGERAR